MRAGLAGQIAASGTRPHPVAELGADVGWEQDSTNESPRGVGRAMQNLRIVIVEDDVFIRLDLMTHLLAAGHTVVGTADSAAEAVNLAEREHPDLVLMDVRLMGEGDGIEAATEIWRRFAVRSLFISANLDSGARARAAAANPVGFLEKPFSPHSLLAAVAADRSAG
jgi:CheY-like chemotaxis protein